MEKATLESPREQDLLRDQVVTADVTNEALKRLQSRARADADVGSLITSYDRMHHRHSRS